MCKGSFMIYEQNFDTEQDQAELENAQTETSDQAEETVEHQEQVAQPVTPSKPNPVEHNMRQLRLAKEKAEREKEAYAQQLLALQQQFNQTSGRTEAPAQQEYGENDFIEGKHLKKEVESVKKEFQQYRQQVQAETDENRLRMKYNDFDKVVNADAIAMLKDQDPEFAETIATSSGSLYARGASTYKRIKELGLYVEDNYQQEREIAQKNLAKPRPVTSISPQQGESPLTMANAFANGLTPELKKQLWKEMNDASNKSF